MYLSLKRGENYMKDRIFKQIKYIYWNINKNNDHQGVRWSLFIQTFCKSTAA